MTSAEHSEDLWVFGYGSLIWRPGFEFEEACPAQIVGYQRAFCVYSTFHRGTEARPGLVLGLDRGGTCAGMAYRVAAGRRNETLSYLRAREQVYGVYRELQTQVSLVGEARSDVQAVTYVVERAHPSYAHRLPFLRQVGIIRGAKGLSGPNVEYLVNTSAHLRSLGIRDRRLERLAVAVGGLFAATHDAPVQLRERAALLAAAIKQPLQAGRRLKLDERRRFQHRRAR